MVAAPRLNRPLMLLALLIAFPATARAGAPDPRATPLPSIDPHTPTGKLLPIAPKVTAAPVYLGDDLSRVPEVTFEALPEKITKDSPSTPEWVKRKAQTAAAVLHLNAKEEDGFLKALLRARPDLAGMPFLMGKDCRTDEARAAAFKYVSRIMHRRDEPSFYLSLGKQRAHIAVMGQNLIAHDPGQLRAFDALKSTKQAEATRQLARAAVFSPDEALRTKALTALASRPADEATDTLVAGLRYPWPAVARNATRAIVKLQRKDLIPQLKAALEQPDPRGPTAAVIEGRKVTVANEVVRVNHLRNCMLCHAPAEDGKTPEGTLTAEIPLPSEPLPDSGRYFDEEQRGPAGRANLFVRIDVTYLRQDFSAMQTVAQEKSAWPRTQRFDYLVRKRELTPAEAEDLRKRLKGSSPFRLAAELAIRELTNSDAEAQSDS